MATPTLTTVDARPRLRSLAAVPPWAAALALGGVGFLASFIGSGNPSLWGDEAASVLSAERPLPSLFRMLGNVDAVHGTYYLFLHFWIRVFGESDVALRFPSAVAAGFVAAGVFLIGSRLASRRLGVVAAIIVAVLPRMVSIGGEARSYAISTAVGVWLTILLLRFLRDGVTRRLAWLGYAAGLALGLYLFLYLALLVPVHGLYVLFRARDRVARRRWAQAVVGGLLLAAPVLYYGYRERAQIAFLAHRNYATFPLITGSQWFGAPSPAFAIAAWIAIAGAVVATVAALRRRRVLPPLALLALPWLVLPTVLLLGMNLLTPSYNLRYLSQSLPAVALVIAMGILALRRRWLVAAATAVAVALAAPIDVQERGPYAFDNSDWRQVSDYVGTVATPGAAVVFDDTVRPSRLPRLAMRMYPANWAGLTDVELARPFDQTSGLWDETVPLDTVAPKLETVSDVLLFEVEGSHDHGSRDDLTTLENLGFTLQHTHLVHRIVVYTLTRGQS
jgi:mannosyltransferase